MPPQPPMPAVRVLETSHPPVYYLPRATFPDGLLVGAPGSSLCEFKGAARYLDVRVGEKVARRAAWYYPEPWPGYEGLRDRVALFPAAMDSCEVDGEQGIPQEGGFYGGWITSRVVGPFKGGPGRSDGDQHGPQSFYVETGQGVFESTPATASPWDTSLQHGGPPSALLARASERCSLARTCSSPRLRSTSSASCPRDVSRWTPSAPAGTTYRAGRGLALHEPATDGLGDVLSDRPGLVWLADLHEAGPPTLWHHDQSSPDRVLWGRETVEN